MQTAPDSKSAHIPYLDGWRGLAIIAVLAFHFFGPNFAFLGALGVFLFFVLSGHLISRILFVEKQDLPTFLLRRFSRIIPAFWLFSAAMFLYAASFQDPVYRTPPGEIFSTLFFFRTYFPSDISIWAGKLPTGHFWSLNVEEHSYALLALGAFLLARRPGVARPLLFVAALTAVIAAINVYYVGHPPSGASPWFVRSEVASIALLFSACLTLLRVWLRPRWSGAVPRWLPILSFCAGLWIYFHASGLDILASFALFALTVNHLDSLPEFVRKLLSIRLLRWFGKCSFSLYLWQQPFYMQAEKPGAQPMLLLAAALAAGMLSFYCFEDPVRRYLNRKWAERSARVPYSAEPIGQTAQAESGA